MSSAAAPIRPRGIFFITSMLEPRAWLEALRRSLLAVPVPEGHPPLQVNLYPVPHGGVSAAIEEDRALRNAQLAKTGTALPFGATEGARGLAPEALLTLDPGPGEVEVAIIADPPRGLLKEFSGLRLLASLWAGIDGFLADPTLPKHVPLVRMVDPEMTRSMAESCLLHSIWSHRQLHLYRLQQAAHTWNKRPIANQFQLLTQERTVGILGLGTLGRAAATALVRHGFNVVGWTRTERKALGVVCLEDARDYGEDPSEDAGEVAAARMQGQLARPTVVEKEVHVLFGEAGLAEVLAKSEVLINLLPLTEETRGVLNYERLKLLPSHAVVVNLARGAHVVENDLIRALDEGILAHAVLDVFEKEPLPKDHPLWTHPKVTITPHVSALTNPRTAGPIIAETVRRYITGDKPLANVIDFQRGY
ncbi:hypothetical protein HDU96_009015 [Phlyctochytrium bullatum]|nr:hypothetical protein HDU96_009015 [Phlyctochytrium bullatum]